MAYENFSDGAITIDTPQSIACLKKNQYDEQSIPFLLEFAFHLLMTFLKFLDLSEQIYIKVAHENENERE